MLFRKFMTAIFAISALAGQAQEKQFSIIPEPAEITVAGEVRFKLKEACLFACPILPWLRRLIFLPIIQIVI